MDCFVPRNDEKIMNNILVIQLTRLGDIIQSIPLINSLKEKYPWVNIDLLINEVFIESSIFFTNINIIPISLKNLINPENNNYFNDLIKKLNDKNYSLIINLNNSPLSINILSHLSCPEKRGFGTVGCEWGIYNIAFMKTRIFGSVNLVDIFRLFLDTIYTPSVGNAFIRSALGKRNDAIFPEAERINPFPTDGKSTPCIALQCGARNIKRQLTIQHYTDIATHYLIKGYIVFLLGMEYETIIAKKIIDSVFCIEKKNIINLTGKTSLKELIYIITKCERIFTPDTGSMHLAALYNIPFTALFYGPAYPPETLAYTDNCEVFCPNPEAFACYPCNEEEECKYDFKCHHFNFQNYFIGKINPDFIKLNVKYDEIGQALSPTPEAALLYRNFAKYYFLGLSEQENQTYSNDLISSLKRELTLWSIIDKNDIELATQNFNLLKPLLYYENLLQHYNTKSILITKAIEYFRKILTHP